jgi:hypothetical protein
MKFTHYEVVFARDAKDLAVQIEGSLKLGWTLIGGVSVTPTDDQGHYLWAQAVAQ